MPRTTASTQATTRCRTSASHVPRHLAPHPSGQRATRWAGVQQRRQARCAGRSRPPEPLHHRDERLPMSDQCHRHRARERPSSGRAPSNTATTSAGIVPTMQAVLRDRGTSSTTDSARHRTPTRDAPHHAHPQATTTTCRRWSRAPRRTSGTLTTMVAGDPPPLALLLRSRDGPLRIARRRPAASPDHHRVRGARCGWRRRTLAQR